MADQYIPSDCCLVYDDDEDDNIIFQEDNYDEDQFANNEDPDEDDECCPVCLDDINANPYIHTICCMNRIHIVCQHAWLCVNGKKDCVICRHKHSEHYIKSIRVKKLKLDQARTKRTGTEIGSITDFEKRVIELFFANAFVKYLKRVNFLKIFNFKFK